ncbi:MAG TPA: PHP domain-containing protein [Chromatiales bacterium]|nr:PHP domain-containing protein [Chromatiales bacterium]
MYKKYDLHSHSTASDGTLRPAELVARAAAVGIDALALTDHDTTAGLDEAATEAQRQGIELINGVEISVTWSGRVVHIVGLHIDSSDTRLQRGLERLCEFRQWRAEEIGRRLCKAGISGAYEGACAFASGGLISRTHFARFLVREGYASDERQVFKHYLVAGKPGHVKGEWADLAEAVEWIRGAGGEAVIAHPARYRLTRTRLRRLLREFTEAGGSALEVVSGSHGKDDCYAMARHANDWGLRASAGSDYHGPEKPWIELGRLPPLPEICVPIWEAWEAACNVVSLCRA